MDPGCLSRIPDPGSKRFRIQGQWIARTERECTVKTYQSWPVLRIRDIRIFFIPDPGSKRFRIPDPDHHQTNLSNFNPKNCFWALGKIIWDVHPGSRIRIIFPSRIPDSDPGSAKMIMKCPLSAQLVVCATTFLGESSSKYGVLWAYGLSAK